MNQGKVGAPFGYSHLITSIFLAFLKTGLKVAYRTVQGNTRGLSESTSGLKKSILHTSGEGF